MHLNKFFYFTEHQKCEYKSLNFLVTDQGRDIIPFRAKMSFDDCKRLCAQTNGCESFSLCDESCHIKDKILGGLEPHTSKMEKKCFTTYKSCSEGTVTCSYQMTMIFVIVISIEIDYDIRQCRIGLYCMSLQMKIQFSSVIRCN